MTVVNAPVLTNHWFHIREKIRVLRALFEVVSATFIIFKTFHWQEDRQLCPRGRVRLAHCTGGCIGPRVSVDVGTYSEEEVNLCCNRESTSNSLVMQFITMQWPSYIRLLVYHTRGTVGSFPEINIAYSMCTRQYTPSSNYNWLHTFCLFVFCSVSLSLSHFFFYVCVGPKQALSLNPPPLAFLIGQFLATRL
jgi:hypothetical protein